MGICGEYGFLEFQSSCIREAWGAIPPAALVFVLCFAYVPIPWFTGRVFESLIWPFKRFLVLHEAEGFGLGSDGEYNGEDQEEGKPTEETNFVPLWRTVVFSFVAIVESFVWIAYGAYGAYNEETIVRRDLLPFLIGFSWIYAAIRPIGRPTATPPYDLFTLYLILLAGSLLQIGGFIFDYGIFDIPLPPTLVLVAQVGNLTAIFTLLAVTVRMPMAIPSNKVDRNALVSGGSSSPYHNRLSWFHSF